MTIYDPVGREKIFRKAIFLLATIKPKYSLLSSVQKRLLFLLLMVYLIHAVENFASVSLTFTTEKCLSYFVKLYFIILKYFVKPYFISHYRAEIFLRLLSSVQKRLLIITYGLLIPGSRKFCISITDFRNWKMSFMLLEGKGFLTGTVMQLQQ